MDTFIYNKPVSGRQFIGRKTELTALFNILHAGKNAVIYDIPHSGKKSLIAQAMHDMRLGGKQFSSTSISLLNVRTLEDFCCRIASSIISSFCTTPDEYASMVRNFLPGTSFYFDYNSFSGKGKIISTDREVDQNDVLSILRLPYKICEAAGNKRLIIILEEFESVSCDKRGEWLCKLFETELKAKATAVEEGAPRTASWIFCGSQYNAMNEIFDIQRYFYKIVERVKLYPVESKEITDHAIKTFLSSGKVVDKEHLMKICQILRGSTYYMNQFCSICDSLSKGYIMDIVLNDAMDCLVSANEAHFIATMYDLTTYQIQLLRAIIDGYKKFSSAEVIRKYGLNSSANVHRLREALCKKEIVTFNEKDEPIILDPLFEYWVTKEYFGIKK